MRRRGRGVAVLVALLLLTGSLISGFMATAPPAATPKPAAGTIATPSAQLPTLTSAGATPSAGDLGDPYLLTVAAGPTGPARYVLFGTGSWPGNVPTAVSRDLKTWTPGCLVSQPRWALHRSE